MRLTWRSGAMAGMLLGGLWLSPVLRASPDAVPEVRLQLADLLFDEARYEEAAAVYEAVRDASSGPVRVRAGEGLVKSLLRTAEFRRAGEEARALVEASPGSATALALHGDALWAAGFFDEAEARYREAATRAPGNARARNGLAKALAARNLLEDALTEARAAVAAAPREGEFHHTLGYVLERLRRYEEAAASMTNYLNLLPNKDRSERALWTAQQVRFLRSFGSRAPYDMGEGGDRLHTVPFRLVRDKIVVEGRVNGGRRMDFVLDTGSELTVLSQRTAERAGVAPIVYTLSAGVGQIGLRGLQVGRIDLLEIGSLKVRNVPTLIKNPPLRGLPTREAEGFSPLALGLSMHIDYRRRVLTMGRELPPQTYSVELPLRHHRLALVRGLINRQRPVHFVVDTGGEVISLSRATTEALGMQPVRRIALRVYGTSGWDPGAFLLTGVDLAFDAIRMPNQPVVVLDLDAPSVLLGFEIGGIVGHKFLSKYRVGIDLRRSVVGLSEG
jgi:tetratricopeptide (TPR) repeat protein